MKFYRLKPEVAGGFGEDIVIDHSVSPPRIDQLHYEFDGWFGDALLTSFPCFIVTERLANELKRSNASGAGFADVKITQSSEFDELFPDVSLPKFLWLKIYGTPGKDDFGISKDNRLVVSEGVLRLLKSAGLSYCDITDWTGDNAPTKN